MTKKKERLKPISFYGHKVEDVIRAFLQTDPKKVKETKVKYKVHEPKKENRDQEKP